MLPAAGHVHEHRRRRKRRKLGVATGMPSAMEMRLAGLRRWDEAGNRLRKDAGSQQEEQQHDGGDELPMHV